MHRLFVAIRPPRAIRERLLGVMGGVRNARWQSDDQLHLTLRFIGEVDRHQAEDVHAALAAVHHPRFEIALSGIGRFGRPGQPGSLWAGVAPQEPLKALRQKVGQAVSRAGLPPERRAFAPHITLARLKRDAGPIDGLLAQWGGLSSAPFAIDAFALYESELTPDGAVYSIVERFPLA